MTYIALFLNIAIIVIEAGMLFFIADKKNILKFYTFLSNFIGLIGSCVFVVVACCALLNGSTLPLWVKGVRFSATFGLTTTLFVFTVILLPRYKFGESTSQTDLFRGIDPRLANLLLHYICPIISIVSFIFFERQPVLADSEWTFYAAIPTIVYWVLYVILTATHLWKEPYGLTGESGESRPGKGALLLLLIPLMSVAIDYLLWWLNTLPF